MEELKLNHAFICASRELLESRREIIYSLLHISRSREGICKERNTQLCPCFAGLDPRDPALLHR